MGSSPSLRSSITFNMGRFKEEAALMAALDQVALSEQLLFSGLPEMNCHHTLSQLIMPRMTRSLIVNQAM